MRRLLFALASVAVMSVQLSLPLALAIGVDPCGDRGDHACPPLGDDCHDCARCQPQPAVVTALPVFVLEALAVGDLAPTRAAGRRPAEAPREPPSRVPRPLRS